MPYMSYADRRRAAEKIKQTATMIVIIGTECHHLKVDKVGYEDLRIVTAPPTSTASDAHRLHRMVTFLSLEFKDPMDFIPENED